MVSRKQVIGDHARGEWVAVEPSSRGGAFTTVQNPKGSSNKSRGAQKGHPAMKSSATELWTYAHVASGIRSAAVRELLNARLLTRGDIRMIIPDRTLERRISAGEPLKIEEADGVARLLRVVGHARQVFDDETTADRWLRLPNPALNGEVPIHMAATDLGAREVEAVLTRLEHGVFS